MTNTTYIALGGNQGPVEKTFDVACDLMAARGLQVTARSRVFITPAVGSQAGDDFRNAAIAVQTELDPHTVLRVVNSIENELGRQRVIHWGPRTLDLDLLLYDDVLLDEPQLQIPHPGCWYRRFVLEPLVEIAPHVMHPSRRLSIHELFLRIQKRPVRIHVSGGTLVARARLLEILNAMSGVVVETDHNAAATMHLWLGNDPSGESGWEALPTVSRCDIAFAEDVVSYGQWVVESMLGT